MNKIVDAPVVLSIQDAMSVCDMVEAHIVEHKVQDGQRLLGVMLDIMSRLIVDGGTLVITPGTTVSVMPVAP